MDAPRNASLISLAVAGLLVACGDPAGPERHASPDLTSVAAKTVGDGLEHFAARLRESEATF